MARHGKHVYGWRRDLPDIRDHLYAAPPMVLDRLPPTTDLRAGFAPCYDQQQLGSCTANAIGGAVEFDWRRQKLPDFIPSRLFIYWQERYLEGTTSADAGAEIRDGFKVIAKWGAPHEHEWPYDITRFTQKPPANAYADGLKRQAIQYARVMQSTQQMRGCLAAGFPFVFGFSVYESFESDAVARTGIVPMPSRGESLLGGHAVVCCGYSDADRLFLVRNSWGTTWGLNGYCRMPYEYLSNPRLASDFWKVTLMESTTT